MRVISFIEDQDIIKRIRRGAQVIKPLGLWEVMLRPPPRMAKAQPKYTEAWRVTSALFRSNAVSRSISGLLPSLRSQPL